MTISTILLPVLALTNAFVYLRFGKSRKRHDAVLARALQVVQALCTTVLATLLFSNIVPSAVRDCLLSTIWQRLFSIHDAGAIRRIQDTFFSTAAGSTRYGTGHGRSPTTSLLVGAPKRTDDRSPALSRGSEHCSRVLVLISESCWRWGSYRYVLFDVVIALDLNVWLIHSGRVDCNVVPPQRIHGF
ncbi:hypothetical protein EsHS_00005290 [Epichloe bromicola]